MPNPEVSFDDIDIAAMTLKENGGIATLSGIIQYEIALIMPDGDTTLYSDYKGLPNTLTAYPGMRYLGVMRKQERWGRRQFDEVAPEGILRGDKLVLLGEQGTRSVRPAVNGLQTRYSGYQSLFSS